MFYNIYEFNDTLLNIVNISMSWICNMLYYSY